MNYRLKLFFVWSLVALIAFANCILFWPILKLLFSKSSSQEMQTIEQMNDGYLIESSLQHEIVDFLQLFYNKRAQESTVFLIDRQMMVKYLQEDEAEKLIRGGYLPADLAWTAGNSKQSFLALGIFKSNMQNIQNKMKHLISIGWEVIMHTANGKLRHVISAIEPLHVVFVKKSVVIQLVVFYPRGDYLWIGGSISNQTAHLIEGTGMYGRHSAIFNQFQLQHRSTLALPVDIPYFIMQMETSRFLECNHHHATRFATLHGDLLFHPNDLTIVSNEAVKSIQVMEHLSRWLNVSIWLWNGSLLSWFRNCGPFQHMYSLDFALSYEQVEHLNLNLTEELLKFASENGKFFVSNILGSKNSTLEYRMKLRDNSESDLFHFRLLSCFKKKNLTIYHRFEVFSHSSENSSVFETTFVHPLFNVCSADYLGQKVLVPCKAAEIILNEFGPDWPVAYGPQWDETFSPLNRVNQSKLSGQGLVNFQDETFKESASLKFFFYLVLLALVVGVLLRCRVWRKQKKLM